MLWWIAIVASWAILLLTLRESSGGIRIFIGIVLAASVLSLFLGLQVITYICAGISVFCIPYLASQGWDFWR